MSGVFNSIFLHAVLATLTGSLTIALLIGAGRSLGLWLGLGSTSAIWVNPFRVSFDAAVSATMCWWFWRLYITGRRDLSELGITGFPWRPTTIQAAALASAILVITSRLGFVHGDRQPPLEGSAHRVILKRSFFSLSTYFIDKRSVDQWLISEAKAAAHFVTQALVPFTGELTGPLGDVLKAAAQAAASPARTAQGDDRAFTSSQAATDSPWPYRPMGTITLLWCLLVWTAPRWYTPLASAVSGVTVRGANMGTGGLFHYYRPDFTGDGQSTGLSFLDAVVLALALLATVVPALPLLVRTVLGAIGALYLSIPVYAILVHPAAPLWTVAMPLPLAMCAARLAVAGDTRIRADKFEKAHRSARGYGRAPDHLAKIGVVAVLGGVGALVAAIWAATSFDGSYRAALTALLRDDAPLVGYLLVLHVLVILLTARRISALDMGTAMTMAFAGFIAAAVLTLGGAFLWMSNYGILYPHFWSSSLPGLQLTGPLPEVWRSGPILGAAGFTLGMSFDLLAPAGNWTITQVKPVEA